jgi:hypothetical protein
MAAIDYTPHLNYVLLQGSYPALYNTETSTKELYEKAFRYWKNFWTQVFIDNGERRLLTSDAFKRQDLITLLLYDRTIIGMHLYSFFDITLESTKEHSYFSESYTTSYLQLLKQNHVKNAMSWEYLTIDPKWRKRHTGISFAMVLLGMAGKIQGLLNLDAGIAVSRNDLKVTEMCQQYGATVVVPHFMMHNTPCALIACFRKNIEAPQDKNIKRYVEELWANKLDLTNNSLFSSRTNVDLKIAS